MDGSALSQLGRQNVAQLEAVKKSIVRGIDIWQADIPHSYCW
jgi:hypothetical protein